MMTSRERVMRALCFQPTDRVPRDLGGMRSTGISAFAYPKLVAALGLPPRSPKIEDTGQMLAVPDLDVLDALGCDVVSILGDVTNAFEQPGLWKPYDFNGRLAAQVRDPTAFVAQADGTIVQGRRRMLPESFVFDDEHGGQPVALDGELPRPELKKVKQWMESSLLHDDRIAAIRDLCRRVRESTDRAVFFNDGAVHAPIAIGGWGGLAVFPILCITEPEWVTELHGVVTEYGLRNLRALVPEIAPYVDVIMMAADDWGTQNNTIASPQVYRDLFLPYRRRMNDEVHRLAPGMKTFLHSCGAIHSILDLVVESGFDVLNPVQWSAGQQGYREWKAQARGRIALWGGGVNSQSTLPLGTVADVEREVREVVPVLCEGSGYVFCNIHNLLAEIPPEKVIAMYRAAADAGVGKSE
jgi:uroporphyrinogen decarboxylase